MTRREDSAHPYTEKKQAPHGGAMSGGTQPTNASDEAARASTDSSRPVSHGANSMPSLASKGLPSPHYDSSTDIVLRHEFVGEGSVKAAILITWFVVFFSIGLLVLVVVLQEANPPSFFFTHSGMIIANVVVGSLLTCASLAMWFHFVWRIFRSNRSGKRWTHRRRRLAMMAGVELSLQIINSLWFLLPNGYVLARECSWFKGIVTWSAFVRWTAWNTCFLLYWIEAASWRPAPPNTRWYVERGEEPGAPVVIDAPLWMHWRKVSVWVMLEACLIALATRTTHYLADRNWELEQEGCYDHPFVCSTPIDITALVVALTACVGFHSLMYAWSISRAFKHLLRLPYNQYRQANFVLRFQMRQRALGIGSFFLCMVCYTFVGFASCRSYVLTWLGYLPSMLIMVGAGIGNGYAMTPKRPQDDGILRVWLQEFAWTEGDEEQCKKAERASSLPPNSLSSVAIEKEPMFCFETALKSLYWSMLVYDHKEVPGSGYCVADALQLYDLKHFELHWDKDPAGLDTKAVVGWSNDTLVIAFRGTASLANVKADVQAWRTPWPRGVGNWFLCTSPMVHWGFLEAWTRNGFCQHILGLVQHMLDSRGSGGADSAPCKPLSVLVTGHSLGGALATLCAFDIASKYPETSIRVRCYTFGAPRTGNHVFARLYNDAVPDTWQLINNDDVVTQAGKFFVLYKRPGFRALINRLGDIVVRPNYVETAIRRLPGATSLRDHLLTSYQAAMASVLGVQFSAKGFATGREGVLSLAQRKGGATVLGMVGLAHDTLHVLQEQGWEGFREMRRRSKQTRQLLRPWPRRKVPGGSHSVEVSLEEGSPDAAQKPGKAAQEPEVEQPAIKAEAEWLRKHASRLALQPTGDLPLELESTMTARGPISLDGASPLDLAAEEQGDRDD